MNTITQQAENNPSYEIEFAAMTSCGPVRRENQDAVMLGGWIAQRTDAFFCKREDLRSPFSAAVIDGMGGYDGGADAACIAASALSKYDLAHDKFSEINDFCNWLSDRILQAGYAWGTAEMGAAFAMLTLDGDMLTVANIGDCRIYRYNAEENILGVLSIDDRLIGGWGGITQSLGGERTKLDAHPYSDTIEETDRFLLCCDGVWETLGDDVLQAILRDNESANDVVAAIKHQCNMKNAPDNCSAIFIKIKRKERLAIR